MRWMVLVLLMLSVLACSPQPRYPNDEERRDFLSLIATQQFQPQWLKFADTMQKLDASVHSACAAQSDASLAELKSAWLGAYTQWSRLETARFGPVTEDNRDFDLAYWPIRKQQIKQLFKPDAAFTLDSMRQTSVAARGLAGMEYILYPQQTQAVLSPAHCDYLIANAALMNEISANVARQWGDFSTALATAGTSSLVFVDVHDAMDLTVNKLVQSVERVEKNAAAVLGGEHRKPFAAQAWRSRTTLALWKAGVEGFKQAAIKALNPLLTATNNQTIQEQLAEKIRTVEMAMNAVTVPVFDAAESQTQALRDVHAALRELRLFLQQSVMPALEVRAGFNDFDGD